MNGLQGNWIGLEKALLGFHIKRRGLGGKKGESLSRL